MATRCAASRTIKASPAEVFRIVADPAGQVRIDGSGMMQQAPEAQPLSAVGDSFVVDMDREPLGDIPMGKYQVRCNVTRIVPDSLVEWNVGAIDDKPYGHVYGWEITPAGPGEVTVTNYCDWSAIPAEVHDRFPIVPLAMMQQSVDRLAGLVAEG